MQTVKNFFGVVLLGLAIWIVSPILPAVVQMLLWAGLLICAAIYLHALDPLPHNASGYRKLWKGVGVIALLVGVALLVGALSGGRDILQPLAGLAHGRRGRPTRSRPDLGSSKCARWPSWSRSWRRPAGRPVMLDFYADWCVSCKEMERFTFTDPQVRARMERHAAAQGRRHRQLAGGRRAAQAFRLVRPARHDLLRCQRASKLAQRVIGFQPADQFAASLDAVLQPAS